ncbi:MAG: response regulator [Patescibacteria group bacterium]
MANEHRILLVDDDKFLLDMYSLKFSQAGFSVQPCFSVHEALEALRAGYDPEVVLFDVTMPGEDGFALMQEIKEGKLAPNARLIALTNQGSDADKKHAEELGVHRYVIKASMIPSEVVAMVKEEMAKSRVQ